MIAKSLIVFVCIWFLSMASLNDNLHIFQAICAVCEVTCVFSCLIIESNIMCVVLQPIVKFKFNVEDTNQNKFAADVRRGHALVEA